MKKILILLLLSIAFMVQIQAQVINKESKEQETKIYKYKVGGTLGFGTYSGWTPELFFSKRIDTYTSLRGSFKFSLGNPFNKNFSTKFGLRQDLLQYRRFTLGSGIDLKYSYANYTYARRDHSLSRKVQHNLSLVLPLTLDIKLTNRLSVNMDYNIHLKTLYRNRSFYSSSSNNLYNSSFPLSKRFNVSYKYM